jgi:hypothetical protein
MSVYSPDGSLRVTLTDTVDTMLQGVYAQDGSYRVTIVGSVDPQIEPAADVPDAANDTEVLATLNNLLASLRSAGVLTS